MEVNKQYSNNHQEDIKKEMCVFNKEKLFDYIISFDILASTQEEIRNFLAWLQVELKNNMKLNNDK